MYPQARPNSSPLWEPSSTRPLFYSPLPVSPQEPAPLHGGPFFYHQPYTGDARFPIPSCLYPFSLPIYEDYFIVDSLPFLWGCPCFYPLSSLAFLIPCQLEVHGPLFHQPRQSFAARTKQNSLMRSEVITFLFSPGSPLLCCSPSPKLCPFFRGSVSSPLFLYLPPNLLIPCNP